MFLVLNRPISIMVLYAIALHACWTAILIFDDDAVHATAVHALFRYIHPPEILATVLAIATALALIGIFTRVPLIVLFLIPQQVLLMMSAAGAIEAIWLAQYADGVVRSRAFLAADQIYSVLAAIGHTAAITVHAMRVVR